MEKKKYYGTEKEQSISYLEFGAIDITNSKKQIWDFQLHDKAYDWLMLARYSNDMVAYINMSAKIEERKLEECFSIYNKELHHGDDAAINLSKLIALSVMQSNESPDSSFFELGQTVYGCIEGMEMYTSLLKSLNIDFESVDLSKTKWLGMDISAFFNTLATVMHSKYDIQTTNQLSEINQTADVFFSKGVTLLYACDTLDRFFEIINKGKIGVFDYSFSLGEEQVSKIGTGKAVTFLSFQEFSERIKKENKRLYVKRSNSKIDASLNRAWVDCVYGDEESCIKYIEKDRAIRAKVHAALSDIDSASTFLNGDKDPEWVLAEEFIG